MAVAAAVVLLGCACGQEQPPVPQPLLAGPFPERLPLGPETRLELPTPPGALSPEATAWFYFHLPDPRPGTMHWEIRAEAAAALEQGTLVHEAQSEVSEGQSQGQVRFRADALSRGGARRNANGRLVWSSGLYSVRAELDGRELGKTLFTVR